jgi:hypothetical protein
MYLRHYNHFSLKFNQIIHFNTRHPVSPFFRVSDHHRPDNERRTPAENMAIIKIYGGTQFPRTALDPTPTRILKNTGCAIIHYSYVTLFLYYKS